MQARPTVSLDPPLDPADVLTSMIVISNDGILDLNNVGLQVVFKEMRWGNGSRAINNLGNFVYLNPPILEPGEHKTERLGVFFAGGGLVYADIGVRVTFRPQYIPFWSKHRLFHFKTVKQADGNVRFVQEPASEF